MQKTCLELKTLSSSCQCLLLQTWLTIICRTKALLQSYKFIWIKMKYCMCLRQERNTESLKGLGHEIIIALKWYGLIGLG
jgi:hypothetical protein